MTEYEVVKKANDISNRNLYPDAFINGVYCKATLGGIRLKTAKNKLTNLIKQMEEDLEALKNAEKFLTNYE